MLLGPYSAFSDQFDGLAAELRPRAEGREAGAVGPGPVAGRRRGVVLGVSGWRPAEHVLHWE